MVDKPGDKRIKIYVPADMTPPDFAQGLDRLFPGNLWSFQQDKAWRSLYVARIDENDAVALKTRGG